ncbi:hypothetical protein [Burkholderia sp.]|uniref:hypothetical protein n=1 Tax=Burkholderia sp. TaxID=36773 RepID=UPI00283A9C7B|nr:hypothetical protein [Burkholderia sp.]
MLAHAEPSFILALERTARLTMQFETTTMINTGGVARHFRTTLVDIVPHELIPCRYPKVRDSFLGNLNEFRRPFSAEHTQRCPPHNGAIFLYIAKRQIRNSPQGDLGANNSTSQIPSHWRLDKLFWKATGNSEKTLSTE